MGGRDSAAPRALRHKGRRRRPPAAKAREGFEAGRARLLAALRSIRELRPEQLDPAIASDLEEAIRRLEDARFRLLVIGEFKRGKSSLINALIGEPLLPVDVLPLTAVATELEYGRERAAAVKFDGGVWRWIPVERLPEFVSETANPGNCKRVRAVTVRSPAALLAGGVRIVDTPGVASLHEHNTQAAYEALATADAALLVLAADQPLTAEERRLHDRARRYCDRVVVVVNRADTVDPAAIPRVLGYVREELGGPGSAQEAIHAVSARDALRRMSDRETPPAAFAAFVRDLAGLLIGRWGDLLLAGSRARLNGILGRLAFAAEVRCRAATLAEDRLAGAQGRFRAGLEAIQARAEELLVLERHALARLADQELRAVVDEEIPRVRERVWPAVASGLAAAEPLSLAARVRRVAAEIGEQVVAEARAVHRRLGGIAESRLGEIGREHDRRMGEVLQGLVGLANDLLEMEAGVPGVTTSPGEASGYYLREWDYSAPLMSPVDRVRLLLPLRWALPHARRLLEDLLERRILQNLNGARWDWGVRIETARARLEASARRQLAEAAGLVEDAIERARAGQAAAAGDRLRAGRELSDLWHRVAELKRRLEADGAATVAARSVNL